MKRRANGRAFGSMPSGRAKPIKYRIHQNVWGNWNGYAGRNRVREFGTDEAEAELWLSDPDGYDAMVAARSKDLGVSDDKISLGSKSSGLKQHLETYVDMVKRFGMDRITPEEFVLKYGRSYPARGVKPPRYGRMKECFMNATQLVMEHENDYTYVEGFAFGCIIPVLHAWCIDKDGNVVDPTWQEEGTEYFGVPFDRNYLYKTLVTREYYGMIDNWQEHWPLLRGEHLPEEFLVKGKDHGESVSTGIR